jgi:hypothetical protein
VEADILYERKLARERQVEDHLFGDKEKFVTAAYKAKLAEQAAFKAEAEKKCVPFFFPFSFFFHLLFGGGGDGRIPCAACHKWLPLPMRPPTSHPPLTHPPSPHHTPVTLPPMRRRQQEEAEAVEKKGHMGDFYRNLLRGNVAFGAGAAAAAVPARWVRAPICWHIATLSSAMCCPDACAHACPRSTREGAPVRPVFFKPSLTAGTSHPPIHLCLTGCAARCGSPHVQARCYRSEGRTGGCCPACCSAGTAGAAGGAAGGCRAG